ncbi:terminase TerL endonuclease subunit [Microbacterium sp. H6]|uniref:terminase TerL endonuclease subunit n=1 Tax=Microbacterium sp. H6 TaxID=421122 RepID=UPI000DE32F2C|nr:terminase TerL endonuclease subunit [Microbacterium sp. H6]RBO73525.1 terminase [Microbacterium sp. H6]
MPRRLLTSPGHDRKRSLGWIATWWIETFVVHRRGGAQGMPIQYGDEYTGFIVDCYAHDAAGKRFYNSAFFSRPKGTDKSGLAAALVLFEAFGPARFAGWAKGGETYEFLGRTYTYVAGEPMGKPVKTPVVKIMATEEGQTGNVFDNVYYNLTDENAPLFALKAVYGVDAGKTRVLIPHNGGQITPSTAGAASKDGGLETFAVFDETHLYETPTLRAMYDTVVRNLSKRRKEGTWFIETTTMYEPGAESVAEDTYFLADQIEAKKARRPRLLFDHRWADIESLDKIKVPDPTKRGGKRLETEAEYIQRLTDGFYEAFGDAIAWNDPEGMLDDLFDPRRAEEDTIRYFFNAVVAGKNAWMKLADWSKIGLQQLLADAKAAGEKLGFRPPMRGDEIALGFDGSLNSDATVLIGCRISDGYVFPIGIWEAPDSKEAKHWQVDHQEVEAVLDATFKKFKVVAFLADPPHWRDYVDRWETKYGPDLAVKATEAKPITFETNQHNVMAKVVERTDTAIKSGELRHGNHKVLTRHVLNAHRWKRTGGDVIGKDRKGSAKKMDAAIGMCLAVEGRARYRKQFKPKSTAVPRRVR